MAAVESLISWVGLVAAEAGSRALGEGGLGARATAVAETGFWTLQKVSEA